MNQDNFKHTLAKKLRMDFDKGKIDASKEFEKVIAAMQKCGIFIDFTKNKSDEDPDAKQAVLRLKIPLEQGTLFEKFQPNILSEAKDLFGTRDGYIISGLEFDMLELPKFAVDRMA